MSESISTWRRRQEADENATDVFVEALVNPIYDRSRVQEDSHILGVL
jgi:hypothetical protein